MRKHPIYFLFILFAWTACEKVIDVDLNEATPAVVIEGNLVYNERNLQVKISRTGSYFGDEPLNKVSGAEVYLETSRDRKSVV